MYREMYVYVRFFVCKIVTLPINTHCVTRATRPLPQFLQFRDRCAQVASAPRRLDRAADDRSHATPVSPSLKPPKRVSRVSSPLQDVISCLV